MESSLVLASLFVASLAAARSSPTVQFLPLESRWAVPLSAPPAAPPLISSSTIVVPLQDGATVAFKSADGSLAWRVDLTTDRPGAADEERAYIASGGAIHAVRITTGAVVWRAETGTLTAPLLVHAGWVIAASGGVIAAFRASDGTSVWQQAFGPVEYRAAIDGDSLFVPVADNRLLGVDLHTGAVRWERRLEGSPSEPLALGGKVYVGASDKHFYTFDASDGVFNGKFRVGAGTRGRAAADADHVYFVAFDNLLRALDRGNGSLKWMKRLPYRPAAGPIVVGNAVLVPGSMTTLPVYAANGADLGKIDFPAPLTTIPAIAADASAKAVMVVVTGDLEHPWTLSLLHPSSAPPPIPVVVLKALPGDPLPIELPR